MTDLTLYLLESETRYTSVTVIMHPKGVEASQDATSSPPVTDVTPHGVRQISPSAHPRHVARGMPPGKP
eukprot:6350393-Prymnesium_polylepis.1